ncbi:DUF4920 domain-containing protein [Cellulophaga baltica]|uniref:DUF4920 domain-containing protein n=1 Tax=Cellulophaga TaxID=104264 RepID=UPI001C070D2D|nr:MULTISPECIES: DUF4920 domain-containing protein [Cellulophaga]MBU2996885.1 DUF4920 domain-containing protein [Cellulophaga baltica]MDO6768282.1 DUF4920 domain-containing protein [Cellulophaga sp. 1_MG-2023]
MKRFNILLVLLLLIISCEGQSKKPLEVETVSEQQKYTSYGARFNLENSSNVKEMSKVYENLNVLDTLQTTFSATVLDVCQAKGCWMKLQLDDKNTTMVKFKDYGFFVPKNIIGKDVVVNGLAFVEQMSVEDQKHYALDGGKSEEEIAKIIKPKKTFRFNADGVLLKE